MGTVRLTGEEAEAIRRLAIQATREGKWEWVRDAAASTGGLPVFGGIGAVLVITPEGKVMSVDSNDGTVRVEEDSKETLYAMVHAARKFPELRGLAPVKPPGARDCAQCGGSGIVTSRRGTPVSRSIQFDCGACSATGWIAGSS